MPSAVELAPQPAMMGMRRLMFCGFTTGQKPE
jgi:hypothetical protein